MKEVCKNCHEEELVLLVKTAPNTHEQWCAECCATTAEVCSQCKELVDVNYAYTISQGIERSAHVCPDVCAMVWVLGQSFNRSFGQIAGLLK